MCKLTDAADRLAVVLRHQPVSHTRSPHAKLVIALGLALDACEELAAEVEGHDCPADEAGVCEDCCLARDAHHLPYQLEVLYGHAESLSRDTERLRLLRGQFGEVLDRWLTSEARAAARAVRRHTFHA